MHNHVPEPSLLDICTQAGMAPLLMGLATIFVLMSIFYVARLFNKTAISACCGFFNPWNEIAHVLCGAGMVAMTFRIPLFASLTFAATFAICALGYASTLLREEAVPNKFWKRLHVLIYLGMSYMFLMPLMQHMLLDWIFTAVYGVAFCFFGKWTVKGLFTVRPFKPLAWGADFFHTLMAGAMMLMFLFPETFMAGSAHHHH